MALVMTRSGDFNLGGNTTYARYAITASPSTAVHNLDDIASVINDDANWTVTKVDSGLYYTEYSILYTGTADNNRMKLISVAANITDNSDGRTVFRFPVPSVNAGNNNVFFQLMGTGSSNANDAAQAHINIGAERNGIRTGWFDVIYDYRPQFGGTGDWRPVDLGLANNPQVLQQFAMAGYPASGSMNTPAVGGPYYTIQWADSENAARRMDADFLDNGMTGNFSMGVFVNADAGNTNSNPHVLASNYTLLSGSAMNGRLGAEVNAYADSDNTYVPQGATVNQYPQTYIQDLKVADSDQVALLRSRGPVQTQFGNATGTNFGMVIKDYPFDRFKALQLGTDNDTNNVTSRTPTLFLDPQPIRGSKFDQVRSNIFHAARGTLLAGAGYTIRFRTPSGTAENNPGFAIRRRNDASLIADGTESNDSYNIGNKDVFNNELDYYAWIIDSEEAVGSKSGYTLDWYVRPNTSSNSGGTNLAPEAKQLYTGSYNVWHGVRGSDAAAMQVKTPYNADTPPERAVTQNIVQAVNSNYAAANNFPISWPGTTPSGHAIQFNATFDSATLQRSLTTDQVYATLNGAVHTVVSQWDSYTQAEKNTNKSAYCNDSGYFKNLTDHDCVLATATGTTVDISDKDSDEYRFQVLTASNSIDRGLSDNPATLQTLRLSDGAFDLGQQRLDCRDTGDRHPFLDGDCVNMIGYAAVPSIPTNVTMLNNTQMNGNYTVQTRTGGAENHYLFTDCAIASGGSLSFSKLSGDVGAGPIYIHGAPDGTTYNTGVVPVRTLNISRDLFQGEIIGGADHGNLSLFSATDSEIAGDILGLGVSGSNVYTYPGITSVNYPSLTGMVKVVWTRRGHQPLRATVDMGTGGGSRSISLTPIAAQSFTQSLPPELSLAFFSTLNTRLGYDADSDDLVIGVSGAVGSGVPNASQTAHLIDNQVYGTNEFNRLINAVGVANNPFTFVGEQYVSVDASRITFTPNATDTQTLGFVAFTGTGDRTRSFTTGGNTYFVNIPSDAPQGLSPDILNAALDARELTADNMRSISLNIPI